MHLSLRSRRRLFGLCFFGLTFSRTRIFSRASITDHANSLNLDFNPGPREVRNGNQCTAWKVPVLKKVLAADPAVAATRIDPISDINNTPWPHK
jgi:hypothetical protein